MKIFLSVLLAIVVVYAVWLMIICAKSKKTIKCFFLLSFLGLACLLIINLLSGVTGIKIPINIYSVGTAGIFSLPGVVGLLIMNLLI